MICEQIETWRSPALRLKYFWQCGQWTCCAYRTELCNSYEGGVAEKSIADMKVWSTSELLVSTLP